MARVSAAVIIALLFVIGVTVRTRELAGGVLRLPSEASRFFRTSQTSDDVANTGTRSAVLIAGSKGYQNYGHQVKRRTANGNSVFGSHVMQYGDAGLSKDNLFFYDNSFRSPSVGVSQRDADLVYFWNKYLEAPEGSSRKVEAHKQLIEAMSHRMHIDRSMDLIGRLLFGIEKGPQVLNAVRPAGQPVVDDWSCLKTLAKTFETHCGSLSVYGLKHMGSVANICNAGIRKEQMAEASSLACVSIPSGPWSSLHKGFSA